VTMYCAWRIADPKQFHKSVKPRDPDEKVAKVQERIRDLLRSAKKDLVGVHNMAAFVNTSPKAMRLDEIENKIAEAVRDQARRSHGVEVVQVGIKSLGLPEQVTTVVIANMKAERQREVKRYESQGEAQAEAIEARAEAARDQILAFAERKAAEIRAEGQQAAAKFYRRFEENPEFSILLRWLESLRKVLAQRTEFVLTADELFRMGPLLGLPPSKVGTASKDAPGK